MNVFITAQSFNVVRYAPDKSDKSTNVVLNVPTIFFDKKEGFKPMAIFEFMRYLFAKNEERLNEYAHLLHRESDNVLSVLLNHEDVKKADRFVAFLGDLYISAQKCNLYIKSEFDQDSLLKFEQWLRDTGEYEKFQLSYQLNAFNSEKGLDELHQSESQKPVLLSRLIMKFKKQSIGSNDIVQYI